jgi:hypothetical protein
VVFKKIYTNKKDAQTILKVVQKATTIIMVSMLLNLRTSGLSKNSTITTKLLRDIIKQVKTILRETVQNRARLSPVSSFTDFFNSVEYIITVRTILTTKSKM